MAFDCYNQMKEDQEKMILTVKPIISLKIKIDKLKERYDELFERKKEILETISEHKRVQKNVPEASKAIGDKIGELNQEIIYIECEMKTNMDEGTLLQKEINSFEKYIASIRPYYRKAKSIYKESDGDLRLTELIILGYCPVDYHRLGMPGNFSLSVKGLDSLLEEIKKIEKKI